MHYVLCSPTVSELSCSLCHGRPSGSIVMAEVWKALPDALCIFFPKHSFASVFLSQYLPGREMCPSLLFNCMKCCTAIRWCHSSVPCPTSLPLTAGFGGAWELVADVYVTCSSSGLSLKTNMSPLQSGRDVSCNSFFYCLSSCSVTFSRIMVRFMSVNNFFF